MMEAKVNRKIMFALMIFVLSVSILFSKLIFPPSAQLIIVGKKSYVRELPNVYTFTDVVVLIAFSSIMTASALYLLYSFQQVVPEKAENSGKTIIDDLRGNERKIYEILTKNGGVMFQSEIVEKSELPKSTVSLTLDKLEAKGVVERRRSGMSNVVILKVR